MRDAHEPEHAAGPGGEAEPSLDGDPDGTGRRDRPDPPRHRTPSPADALEVDPEDDPADVLGGLAGFGDVRGITDLSGLLDVAGPDFLEQVADEVDAADGPALEDLADAVEGATDLDDDADDDPDDDVRGGPAHPPIFGADRGAARAGTAVAGFRRLATSIADAVLALNPETAPAGTRAARLARLADLTPEGTGQAAEVLADALTALDAVDDTVLPVPDAVDLEILRVWVAGLQWDLMDAPAAHDPLRHVPARLLPAPWDDDALPAGSPLDTGALETVAGLLRTAQGRLADLAPRLEHARDATGLSVPAVDAALARVRRLRASLPDDVAALTAPVGDEVDALAPGLSGALGSATAALDVHEQWLLAVRRSADADPRIGARRYAARLWYLLDVELDPDALLVRAESDLLGVEEELAELAGLLGAPTGPEGVRDLLRSVAADDGRPPAGVLADVAREVVALDLVSVDGVVGGLAGARCPLAGADERSVPDTPAPGAVGGALRDVVAAHSGGPGPPAPGRARGPGRAADGDPARRAERAVRRGLGGRRREPAHPVRRRDAGPARPAPGRPPRPAAAPGRPLRRRRPHARPPPARGRGGGAARRARPPEPARGAGGDGVDARAPGRRQRRVRRRPPRRRRPVPAGRRPPGRRHPRRPRRRPRPRAGAAAAPRAPAGPAGGVLGPALSRRGARPDAAHPGPVRSGARPRTG